MNDSARITASLHEAVDELNEQLPPDRRLAKSPATVLAGPAGGLDSLGLVTFVVIVQQKLQEGVGVSIALADEALWSGPDAPLATLGSLAAHVARRLEDRRRG